jgi:ribonuclease/clavin/mitogillin
MSKIIDAVSIVMTCGNEIFAIQRQNFLKAFPGYWAFPGGKVEKEDESFSLKHEITKDLDHRLFGAAVREGQEELGIDLREEIKAGRVRSVHCLGLAVTPDFNPYRFATYFFKIDFTTKVDFVVDRNEAHIAQWMSAEELLKEFNDGQLLAVPPVIKVIESLGKDPGITKITDINFEYDGNENVPFIESIKGIKQVMPLSHTLPPANRTNAFVIGGLLLDPSPKDSEEYRKFKNTIAPFGVEKIVITHHHPDHYERSNELARDLNLPILLSAYTHDRIQKRHPGHFEVIKEGDVVTKWLGRNVIVMEIPGHDEGQIALYPEDLSWFIAGDLFQGVGTVVIGGEEGDMQKYFNTLQRIINLGPKVVIPSHGIGLGGTNILEKTLDHRKMSENEMLERIYKDVARELWPYALENINKHLQKLRADGAIN